MMRRLSDEMDRLFQGFGFPREAGTAVDAPWLPALETFTRDGHWVVRAELPGLTDKDVSVEVSGDTLEIKGERRREEESTRDGRFTSERSYGRFLRAVTLPDGVVTAEAKASFKNGVLEVSMPQRAQTPPAVKRVEVTAG
jgi:HSP20 family protein